MAINKVIYGADTLIDLTGDTITPDKLAKDVTAHDKSGEPIVGTNTFDSDTSDATVAVAEILAGKTAYARGAKITGTMKNNGAVALKIKTKEQKVTVAQGYHDGSGTAEIDATEQAKLIPSNIRSGVSIFDVLGTFEGSGGSGGVSLDGISEIEVGTFTPASSAITYSANCSMSATPNLAAYVALGDFAALATTCTVHSMFIFRKGSITSEKTTNAYYDASASAIKGGSQTINGTFVKSRMIFPTGNSAPFLAGVTYMYIFAKIDDLV